MNENLGSISPSEILTSEEPINYENGYWVSYQFKNGTIGTWGDYAHTPDEFINALLEQEGQYIAKFLELEQEVDDWPATKNIKISVAKYNRRLKSANPITTGGIDQSEDGFSEGAKLTFRVEHDLQLVLRANIEQLQPGLKVIDGGKERITEAGRIDITAMDVDGNTVVIELKRGTALPQAVDQILAYMDAIAKTDKKAVRGILIAADFHKKVIAAAHDIHNLELKKYSFQFSFEVAK